MANPIRFPKPPNNPEEILRWARDVTRSLNQMVEDVYSYRTAEKYTLATPSVAQRTITSTYTATEVREFVIQMANDLQEKGQLP